jgi:hypothetical protein
METKTQQLKGCWIRGDFTAKIKSIVNFIIIKVNF